MSTTANFPSNHRQQRCYRSEDNGEHSDAGTKPGRKAKEKPAQQPSGSVGVAEIKKAAAFANSVGGLDQAIALLQILKVAREM